MNRTKENSREAVERMMNAHGDSMLRLCCLYLRDAALAQDAVQETFLKAYRHYDGFRHESSEKTWLTRIALSTCRDMRRGAWFRLVDRSITLDDVHAAAAEKPSWQGDVTQAVMALDIKYRVPILLHYYQDVPVKEIAAMLHLPLGTVLSRMNRGREQLKKRLSEGGELL